MTSTPNPASLALREAAARRPADIAIDLGDHAVSFGKLNTQADCLAQRLVERGRDGDRIALRANGTHASAVGFVAIQRAGMVSVPIDPTAPHERLRAILADVEAALLLSDVEGDEDVSVPIGHPLTFGADTVPRPIDRDRGDLVSIVYTSGSSGAPKGILIGREQMDRTFVALPSPDESPGARVGVIFAGTAGNIERLIVAALFRQEALVSYEIRRRGVAALGTWLERERIVEVSTVPTVLRHLLSTLSPEQRFPHLRMVVLSGETCMWGDITRLRRHLSADATIVNAFGLTEVAGIAELHITGDVPAEDGPVPAGKLSATARVTIVGDDGEPVAPGQRGEIVVEGPDCALGYWRRPDLTEKVFTLMPSGYRRVRTGDGGRIRPDGMLEHLGRIDHVVKIAGNRVELGEVEHALLRIDGVTAAAAATYTDNKRDTRLTAAVVPAAGAVLNSRLLRAELSRVLPGYMLPERIVITDTLPQLVGGKVDRAAVADLRLDSGVQTVESARPLTRLEQQLSKMWCEILQRDAVHVDDDFFALGGDSLGAASLFAEIESVCGIDRPMSLLAEAPTIASLALALSADSDWTSLLAVQPAGSKLPLFVVHDGTAGVVYARGLVPDLGSDQPIYGVRGEAASGVAPRERTLIELAASYCERIQALYPHGPYRLYGASLGGVVALEIARQLLAAGDEVPLVVLGDSFAPTWLPQAQSTATRAAARMAALRSVSPAHRLSRVAWLASRQLRHRMRLMLGEGRANRRALIEEQQAIERAVASGEPVPPAVRTRYSLNEYDKLIRGHEPRPPYPERVVLLFAFEDGGAPDRGWHELLGERLEIAEIPGTHDDLGREASGVYVGPIMARLLGVHTDRDAAGEGSLSANGTSR